jgi:ADP-ribosyl-[dinitrogen reductase] hydrolase
MQCTLEDRYLGSLIGLACGDAVGTAVEFSPRGSFQPLTGMTGGGPFSLPPGYWTDDTSMALCLAESLCSKGGFDARDQMNRYASWWQWGYLSSTGECFDIGLTVREALMRFLEDGEPFAGSTDPRSAGNGSLMRLAPIALFYHPDSEAVIHYAAESSRTTHAAPEAVECCKLLALLIHNALSGYDKERVLDATNLHLIESKVSALASGANRTKQRGDVAGTGYAVSSLDAALWCFHTTRTFESAVLEAATLGDDADTTAAIAGQLAGAFYGIGAVPCSWLDKLHMHDEISAAALALFNAAQASV